MFTEETAYVYKPFPNSKWKTPKADSRNPHSQKQDRLHEGEGEQGEKGLLMIQPEQNPHT